MGIQAVSHVAIGVRDMDRALGFYHDVLGLRITADRMEEFAQGEGQEPQRRRAVFLRYDDGPDASYVVLNQQLSHEAPGEPAKLFQIGIHHFAFWVDDLVAMTARARAAGATVAMGDEHGPGADTEWYGEAPGGRIGNVILRDPEGNYVQLDQRL